MVHDLPGIVGRDVVVVVRVMETQPSLGAAVGHEVDQATHLRVPVVVVERVDPVGRELCDVDGIGRWPRPASEPSVNVGGSIRPGAHAGGRPRLTAAASSEDLHDTGHGI